MNIKKAKEISFEILEILDSQDNCADPKALFSRVAIDLNVALTLKIKYDTDRYDIHINSYIQDIKERFKINTHCKKMIKQIEKKVIEIEKLLKIKQNG